MVGCMRSSGMSLAQSENGNIFEVNEGGENVIRLRLPPVRRSAPFDPGRPAAVTPSRAPVLACHRADILLWTTYDRRMLSRTQVNSFDMVRGTGRASHPRRRPDWARPHRRGRTGLGRTFDGGMHAVERDLSRGIGEPPDCLAPVARDQLPTWSCGARGPVCAIECGPSGLPESRLPAFFVPAFFAGV